MQLLQANSKKLYLVVDEKGEILDRTYSWAQAHRIAHQKNAQVMKQENLFD